MVVFFSPRDVLMHGMLKLGLWGLTDIAGEVTDPETKDKDKDKDKDLTAHNKAEDDKDEGEGEDKDEDEGESEGEGDANLARNNASRQEYVFLNL